MEVGDLLRHRYKISKSIGRGAMADVFLAFDMRRQVYVAIKVLREDLAEDPEFVRRFSDEARSLALLDHPHIVRFYSFERQGALAYMILDYIPGTTLRRLLFERQGPLLVPETTSILKQVSAALYYAHREGIIHRDLKPGNVMIRNDGVVLLADFGIAKIMESATITTAAVGTPAYMSPEQIRGQRLTPATDIYSLGVMLFQMVTGQRPFGGHEQGLTSRGTLARLREAHLRLPPPDPVHLNPALNPAAASVILQALAKDPAERWPDVMSMLRAWEDAVDARSMSFLKPTGLTNTLANAKEAHQIINMQPAPQPLASSPVPEPKSGEQVVTRDNRHWLWAGIVGTIMILVLLLMFFLNAAPSSPGLPTSQNTRMVSAQEQKPLSELLTSPSDASQAVAVQAQNTTGTETVDAIVVESVAVNATGTAQVHATRDAIVEERIQATAQALGATSTAVVKATQISEARERQAEATRIAAVHATQTIQVANATATAIHATETAAAATANAQALGPPTCDESVGAAFSSLWEQQAIYTRLQCPTSRALTTLSAVEKFQHGFMLWRKRDSEGEEEGNEIYVLFDNGRWRKFSDHFKEGVDQEYSCGEHQSPPSPRRGFSKIWCGYTDVRNGLGYAEEREQGYGMAGGGPAETFQDFAGGLAYHSNHFQATFILFNDNGTWWQP